MDDLILFDDMLKKKDIINDFIEFDCSAGRKAYSDNDFVLKTVFDKDKLINIGEWISYGKTDYAGIIRRRTIDTKEQIVIYEGSTLRGVLDCIVVDKQPFQSYYGTDYKITGTMQDIFQSMANAGINGCGWMPVNRMDIVGSIEEQFEASVLTTNNLAFASLLSLHDNVVRQCSTGSTPKKSKLNIEDDKIKIEWMESKIHYVDSTHAFVKFVENDSTPSYAMGCYPWNKESHEGYSSPFFNAYVNIYGEVVKPPSPTPYKYDDDHNLSPIVMLFSIDSSGNSSEDLQLVVDTLKNAQEKPSTELTTDIETAEIDDVIVASIAELDMRVTKKVVESTLHISNGIPKITYTLEG